MYFVCARHTLEVSFLFSDRGIPDGYRHMHGYGSHTFKVTSNAPKPQTSLPRTTATNSSATYVKFHFRTNQGIRNLSPDVASNLAASDPDYAIRDLYNAIANKENPSWTLCVQVMSAEVAERVEFNPFDVTKVCGYLLLDFVLYVIWFVGLAARKIPSY